MTITVIDAMNGMGQDSECSEVLRAEVRRLRADLAAAEQRAERAEVAAAMLRKALEDIAHDDWTYDTTKARAALTAPATQPDERAAADTQTGEKEDE